MSCQIPSFVICRQCAQTFSMALGEEATAEILQCKQLGSAAVHQVQLSGEGGTWGKVRRGKEWGERQIGKSGKGKVTANTTRKSLLIEPTLLIANDHNTIRASIPCQETRLSISPLSDLSQKHCHPVLHWRRSLSSPSNGSVPNLIGKQGWGDYSPVPNGGSGKNTSRNFETPVKKFPRDSEYQPKRVFVKTEGGSWRLLTCSQKLWRPSHQESCYSSNVLLFTFFTTSSHEGAEAWKQPEFLICQQAPPMLVITRQDPLGDCPQIAPKESTKFSCQEIFNETVWVTGLRRRRWMEALKISFESKKIHSHLKIQMG